MMPLSKIFYEVLMITTRDIELFRKLSLYGMLSTKQVGLLVFSSIASTTVLRRLRLLESGFYVKRVQGLESQEVLWVLADRGAKMAEVEVPKRHWSKNTLEHDFKLLSLRLALESTGVAHSWMPEHEIRSLIFKNNGFRAAKEKLIPDGFMGIEVGGFRQSVAIELELTMKNSKRYEQTFRKYSEKRDLHAIWYLAPTKGTVDHIYSIWKRIKSLYGCPILYLSYLDEVMKDPWKARLMGENCHQLDKLWTQKKIEKTAHSPAQWVSSQEEKKGQLVIDLSAEDHTPILENVS